MPESKLPLIFVIGTPRSGTTFVINALVKNQDLIAGTPRESMIYTWGNDYVETIDQLVSNKYFSGYLGAKEISQIGIKGTFIDFWERSIEFTLRNTKAEYFAEKSPVHTLFWKTLSEKYKPKFILVERSPSATIHSMVKTKWIPLVSDRLPGCIKRWKFFRYYAALLLFARYQKAVIALKETEVDLLNLRYEDVISGECDLKSELELFLKIELNKLYEVKPFSGEPHDDGQYTKVLSRIDAYKSTMPKLWQRVVRNVYQPQSSWQGFKGKIIKWVMIKPFIIHKSSGR